MRALRRDSQLQYALGFYRVTPTGAITPFAASFGITTGPDDNIWFTEGFNDLIGRLNLCPHPKPGHGHDR